MKNTPRHENSRKQTGNRAGAWNASSRAGAPLERVFILRWTSAMMCRRQTRWLRASIHRARCRRTNAVERRRRFTGRRSARTRCFFLRFLTESRGDSAKCANVGPKYYKTDFENGGPGGSSQKSKFNGIFTSWDAILSVIIYPKITFTIITIKIYILFLLGLI